MNQTNTYTYAPNPHAPAKWGRRRPAHVRFGGRLVPRIPDERLPEADWYPEYRDALPKYNDGYAEVPVVELATCRSIYRPIVPTQEECRARAMRALWSRLNAERDRRAGIATVGIDMSSVDMMEDGQDIVLKRQLSTFMQIDLITWDRIGGQASADQIAAVDAMRSIPAIVLAIDQARVAIYAWADQNLVTTDAIDAFDIASPPAETPSWPTD